MRAALYIRVSTDEQAAEGYSLDAQLDRLKMYCNAREWEIASVYQDDGYSAKNLDRPAMQRLMKDVKKGLFDTVLILKLDRLTRSVLNLHELLNHFLKYNVGLNSVVDNLDTKSASGRLFMNIMASVAEWERETISERVKMAMTELTRQGKWSGGKAAFGYRNEDKLLRVYEPEAKIVRELFIRYTAGQGTMSLLQWLNDEENPQLAPQGGRRWTQNALKYLLRNPLYAGMVRYGFRDQGGRRNKTFQVAEGKHEAIIPKDVFEKAEAVRLRRRTQPGRSDAGTYALSGILRCGKCGSAMTGSTKYRTNKSEGEPRRYYMCMERMHSGLCKLPMVLSSKLEELVLQHIEQFYTQEPTTVVEDETPPIDITSELAKINRQRDRWKEAYALEAITASVLRDELLKLDKQEMQLRQLVESETPTVDANEIRQLMKQMHDSWEHIPTVERKTLLHTFIERIELQEDGHIDITYRA